MFGYSVRLSSCINNVCCLKKSSVDDVRQYETIPPGGIREVSERVINGS